MRTVLARVAAALLLAGAVAACGGSDGGGDDGARIVVTTNILGDVVRTIVGDGASVDVIMPPGSNPHDFAPSAKQAVAMREADVLVVNGRGFEEGLVDTISAAEDDGTVVVAATDALDTATRGTDPHVFTDPVLMQSVVEHLEAALAADVPGLDTAAFHQRVDDYLAALDDLDAEVTDLLAAVPADRRVLVTNHQVLGFFADRYGFEVLGVVIPGGTTLAEPSAADLAELADGIAAAGVPAIFAETSAPARLADALAAEGTDVAVVELYTESLGEPGGEAGTYLDMVRTNAERIAAALGGSG